MLLFDCKNNNRKVMINNTTKNYNKNSVTDKNHSVKSVSGKKKRLIFDKKKSVHRVIAKNEVMRFLQDAVDIEYSAICDEDHIPHSPDGNHKKIFNFYLGAFFDDRSENSDFIPNFIQNTINDDHNQDFLNAVINKVKKPMSDNDEAVIAKYRNTMFQNLSSNADIQENIKNAMQFTESTCLLMEMRMN